MTKYGGTSQLLIETQVATLSGTWWSRQKSDKRMTYAESFSVDGVDERMSMPM